jgi:endonuclease III
VTAAQPIPDAEGLRAAVLGWYRAHGRELAFRGTTDPWAILVSEFMAQQTQAARAAEAWQEFLALYPTPAALAAATPADAIRAWRGLGYNRRAIALRAAAIAIIERHAGQVPADLESLDALPGVGPYTARAVAALAYGARVGPVDTNVRRVLGRARFAASVTARELQADAEALAARPVRPVPGARSPQRHPPATQRPNRRRVRQPPKGVEPFASPHSPAPPGGCAAGSSTGSGMRRETRGLASIRQSAATSPRGSISSSTVSSARASPSATRPTVRWRGCRSPESASATLRT